MLAEPEERIRVFLSLSTIEALVFTTFSFGKLLVFYPILVFGRQNIHYRK